MNSLNLNRTEADGVNRELPDDGGMEFGGGDDKHCEGVTAGDGVAGTAARLHLV